MADDYSRVWIEYLDDLDAENLNDLEDRMEARVASSGAGIELGYAENTVGTVSTQTAVTDLDSLSVTIVVGTRPINIRFHCDSASTNAGLGSGVYLNEDGTNLGVLGSIGSGFTAPLDVGKRLNPSAGTHVYKIRHRSLGAGTFTMNAGAGTSTAFSPMAIQVLEV